MKIAFFTYPILECGGGLAKYFIEIPSELKKCYPDLNISVISLDEKMTEGLRYLLSFYYFRKISRSNLYREESNTIVNKLGKVSYIKCKSFKELKKELLKYDIIYSKNEILEALIIKFLIGYKNLPPVIFGCHTPIFYPITKSIQSKLHNILYGGVIYRFLANGVRKFHVINSFTENKFKKMFPQKKIVKIYNPFDFDNFVKKSKNYRYKFNFDKTKFNIMWSGRLYEPKGIDDLVKIVDEINKTEHKNEIIWNIVGDGNKEEKSKILNLKNKWDNLNYFGYVENNYIASLYKENNLFISTSKWESFPYNLLEAQTFGLPIVAYDISGCNDIIENDKNGFLVNSIEEFKKKTLFFVNGGKLKIDIGTFIRSKFNRNGIYNSLINMFMNHAKKD